MYQIDIWKDIPGNAGREYVTTVLFDGEKSEIYNYLCSIGIYTYMYIVDSECDKWIDAYIDEIDFYYDLLRRKI